MLGTWKYSGIVLMFDPDGSCQQVNLHTGEEESGKYKVEGINLSIDFDSGRGLRYRYKIRQDGNLEITDTLVGNTIVLIRKE